MSSSMETEAHGVRVVTHIIPLDTPSPPSPSESKETLSMKPYSTRMFLKGKPTALGTVQVFIGLVMMSLGIITWVTGVLHGEILLGLGISCLICGAVTLAAHKGTSPPLIKSTLALNIFGTLLAISGICYFCIELASSPVLDKCGSYTDQYWDCRYAVWNLMSLITGLKILLLILSVLEMCVCTTLIVFSCKSTCKTFETKMVVTVLTGDSKCNTSHESLLKGEEAVDTSDDSSAYKP